jgi:hypothetical protein
MTNQCSTVNIKNGEDYDSSSNSIPVLGRGGPYGCETSRLPHFLENHFRDVNELVGLTCRPAALCSQEDPWCSFLLKAESTPAP